MVGNVIDELLKLGCDVVYESMYEVHVSGHACQEELKIIHSLVKPEFLFLYMVNRSTCVSMQTLHKALVCKMTIFLLVILAML